LHQESDGNFHVYYDRASLLVVSEIYADSGHELSLHLPSITESMAVDPPKEPGPFGGKVVVFDAAMAGNSIRLEETGREVRSASGRSKRFDAVMVDVEVVTGKHTSFIGRRSISRLMVCT
jgi:hypothetical protein